MGTLPIYLLFAAIPFWHLRPFGYISVYEMVVVFNLLFVPLYFAKARVRWNRVDALVFLFALYGILTVAISSSSAYESVRMYRYLVLGPVLLYFMIRVFEPNQGQFAKGMVIFSSSVAVQALVVIYYVITYGERPAGDTWEGYQYQSIVASIVTFSVLAVMAASASLYLAWQTRGLKRYALLLIGIVCSTGVLASATRASALGFFLLFPLSGWFLRRTFRRKLLVTGGYLVLAGVTVAIAISLLSGPSISLDSAADNRRAIERVIDIEEYQADLSGRLAFWATLTRQGFSSPVFGKGMASFDIGTEGGTSFHISSAHNALVSAFYTSGVVGLVILLLLWHSALRGIYQLNHNIPSEMWRARFLIVSLMVLLLVSMTNDLTAGRGNLQMLLLALLNYRPLSQANQLSAKVPAAMNAARKRA